MVEIQTKKRIALSMFLAGDKQKDIAEQVGVSRKTICDWAKKNNWEKLRAAKALTRTELINKMYASVNKLLDEALEKDDVNIADKLAKVASAIEKLNKKNPLVEAIDVLSAFGRWLKHHAELDPSVDREFVKKVLDMQEQYIGYLMAGNDINV